MTARRTRLALKLLAAIPAVAIVTRGLTGNLGVNPVETVLNNLGYFALVLLLASLACTPLGRLGLRVLTPARRIWGLAAFWYALAHVALYVSLEQGFDLHELWIDITKRRFIIVGAAAFSILAVLAITSPASMVRRLGGVRWRRLHRLVYVAAALAVVHFVWKVKADATEPFIFGGVLLVLLLARVVMSQRAAPVASSTPRTRLAGDVSHPPADHRV
jgi:sulfoxide reductase heme-binding subunit YedZ